MSARESAWLEHQRRRFMRPDAERFWRPDAARFMTPEAARLLLPPSLRPAEPQSSNQIDAAEEAKRQREYDIELAQIKSDFAALRFQIALAKRARAQCKANFNPDQPRVPAGNPDGGQWTYGDEASIGDEGTSTDISAQRRRPPRANLTPAQQARLALAKARADAALARVRAIDPTWRPRESLTGPKNSEGIIQAKEAEAREAEAHYLELLRAGADPTSPGLGKPSQDVLRPGGELVGRPLSRARAQVTTVPPQEFENIRSDLMIGARAIETPERYNGLWFRRDGGVVFGVRSSRDHGLTIDVIESKNPLIRQGMKVHQR
jgi:hypothetical protein